MRTREEKTEKYQLTVILLVVCMFVSVSLIVAGFIVPPTGVIDGSVLTAVGELLAFPALALALRAVELGYDLKMTHGDHTIEISDNKEAASNEED